MDKIKEIFENNHEWSIEQKEKDVNYFTDLANNQTPHFLWIGCSDSRVPAELLTKLTPGDLFVHRNIANMVLHTDTNCLTVVEYAIEVLNIEYIIICGHTNCGGIRASMRNGNKGHLADWLLAVKDTMLKHNYIYSSAATEFKETILTKLNVVENVYNLGRTSMVQSAWKRGKKLIIFGWVYDVSDGYLIDLGLQANSRSALEITYRKALSYLKAKF